MASKDLVTIADAMTVDDVLGYLEHPDHYTFKFEDDPEVIQRSIEARDLGAASADELFGDVEVLHAKDMIGKPFELVSVEARPSTIEGEGGLPFYVLLTIVTTDGSKELMSCGARSVVRRAAVAAKRGYLPKRLRIIEETTSNGYKALNLVSAENAAKAGDEPF